MSKQEMHCPHKDKVGDCPECMAILYPAPADGGDEPTTMWLLVRSAILTNESTKVATDQIMGLFAQQRLQDRNTLVEQLEAAKETLNKDTDDAMTAVICGGNAALDAAKWLVHDHYKGLTK